MCSCWVFSFLFRLLHQFCFEITSGKEFPNLFFICFPLSWGMILGKKLWQSLKAPLSKIRTLFTEKGKYLNVCCDFLSQIWVTFLLSFLWRIMSNYGKLSAMKITITVKLWFRKFYPKSILAAIHSTVYLIWYL